MRGVIAVQSKAEQDCLWSLYRGTFGLQFRGQEYCGMSTRKKRGEPKIRTHRGLVKQTFANDLRGLEGFCGIGSTSNQDRQPILKYARFGPFTIAFDGFIRNARKLRGQMLNSGDCLSSLENVELLASIISREADISDGIARAMESIHGGFSLVMLTAEGIYLARSTDGLFPLVLGEGEESWVASSESAAFGYGGWRINHDIAPGEIIRMGQNGFETLKRLSGKLHICSFFWIYFGQPESISDGIPVARVRHNLGRFLAEADDVEADIVAPIPFSGIMHAEGYHLASGLPLLAVFKLPQFSYRTYNLPIKHRLDEQEVKLMVIDENVRGMRIVLVDDSIRAGVILRGTIAKLRQHGAKEVHVRIASPISVRNCPYAPPAKKEEEYIAAKYPLEKVREIIGADTLRYQRLGDVPRAIGLSAEDLCLECFQRV